MKIALAQLSLGSDMEKNFEKTIRSMEEAAANGARAICFPEIHLSPFFPQHPGRDMSQYAIDIDHPMIVQIGEKSKALGIVCFPNVYLQEGGLRFDASPVIDSDGTLLGVSKMVHIVQAPCFYEQDYYAPSDTGFQVYGTSTGRAGVVICFDRHFPESIRTCVLKGAQFIVIPTANAKGEPLEMFEWEMRVSAMQNGVFIAMCNRVGPEDDMDFCGESLVVDPNGEVVAKADGTEQILYAGIELSMVEEVRKARPYLALRRPDTYKMF